MTKTIVALWALAAWGGVQAQAPQSGLKAGLWESRTTRMTADGQDMLAQITAAAEQMKKQMASLPPEQRKKAEAMLPPHGSDPLSQRICISPEMAQRDQPMVPRPHNADCQPPKLDRSGHRTTFEIACKQGGASMTGKGEIVVAGDLITTQIETTGKDAAGKAHTMQAETQMKFLGSNCGKVKPLDQSMKDLQGKAAAAPRPPAK